MNFKFENPGPSQGGPSPGTVTVTVMTVTSLNSTFEGHNRFTHTVSESFLKLKKPFRIRVKFKVFKTFRANERQSLVPEIRGTSCFVGPNLYFLLLLVRTPVLKETIPRAREVFHTINFFHSIVTASV